MTKICILGNCQAQHMEAMIATASAAINVIKLDPVFLMNQSNRDEVYDKLDKADLIFAQRITNEFSIDWVASAAIKQAFGDKVAVWPNIYFDGYFPGVSYIYLHEWGKLPSPLLEYHFMQVVNAYKAGKTVAEAVAAFSGEQLITAGPGPFEMSLENLRQREADVDVPISDFIANQAPVQKLFYTPNHPVNALLGEMLRRLASKAGLKIDLAPGIAMPYKLDEVYITSSAYVVGRYNLPFDVDAEYKGRNIDAIGSKVVSLGKIMRYDATTLTQAFFRLYDYVWGHSFSTS